MVSCVFEEGKTIKTTGSYCIHLEVPAVLSTSLENLKKRRINRTLIPEG
jgi:hypothetical protein